METSSNRREFIKSTTLAAGAIAAGLSLQRSAHAAGSDLLKIGLVGCGGRGTGAAGDALGADANTKLVAMADAFDDRLQSSLGTLKRSFGDRAAVDASRCFVGFDAYKKLLETDVNVVLLATSPHFRPIHLKACIDAGKHVFCEKPVAVDAPGVRSVMATCDEAAKKNLTVVSGLCYRYDPAKQETIKRIHDGAIGDIVAIQETYNTGTLWQRPRQPSWTEMIYQMRNWYYFTWLSGDHNVEQHIHSLDKAAWALGDQLPSRAWGLGGRQVRVDPRFGDIYDHHAVCYEYENGVRVYSYCRQMADCSTDVSDLVLGTKGRADLMRHQILDRKGKVLWKYNGSNPSMYACEHQALFGALRAGKTINNGSYMAQSTMMAILGRMTTHSGQTIDWQTALASNVDLSPAQYAMDATPPTLPDKDGRYVVDMPGGRGAARV